MYRYAEVPTDSTLERVEAGIPHPPCRSELNPSCVLDGLCLTALALFAVVEGLRIVDQSSQLVVYSSLPMQELQWQGCCKLCLDMMSDTWYALSQTTLWYAGSLLYAARHCSARSEA